MAPCIACEGTGHTLNTFDPPCRPRFDILARRADLIGCFPPHAHSRSGRAIEDRPCSDCDGRGTVFVILPASQEDHFRAMVFAIETLTRMDAVTPPDPAAP